MIDTLQNSLKRVKDEVSQLKEDLEMAKQKQDADEKKMTSATAKIDKLENLLSTSKTEVPELKEAIETANKAAETHEAIQTQLDSLTEPLRQKSAKNSATNKSLTAEQTNLGHYHKNWKLEKVHTMRKHKK